MTRRLKWENIVTQGIRSVIVIIIIIIIIID